MEERFPITIPYRYAHNLIAVGTYGSEAKSICSWTFYKITKLRVLNNPVNEIRGKIRDLSDFIIENVYEIEIRNRDTEEDKV